MIELLLSPHTTIFSTSLGILLGIGMIEVLALAVGTTGLSDFIDLDLNLDGTHTQGELEISRYLEWMRIGKVPALMLLVLFLGAFGLSGLLIQSALLGISGHMIPQALVAAPAMVLSFPLVRSSARILAKILPRDETSAVSVDSLTGRVALLFRGNATIGLAAEGKVRDIHGKTHYLLIKPEHEEETLPQGSQVLLTRRDGEFFRAILNPYPTLLDGNNQ
jgi:hypothetical protein